MWVPVYFGLGIAIYFMVPTEPSYALDIMLVCLGIAIMLIGPKLPIFAHIMFLVSGLVVSGFGYAGLQTHWSAAPVLGWRYYGPIEGRIINIDRSASNAPRVTLDKLYLPELDSAKTPARVRISLQGYIAPEAIVAGGRITTTGSLAPPGAPSEPGGFDFRRMAWFMRLGGIGYTRNPALRAEPTQNAGLNIAVFKLRMRVANAVRGAIGGQNGAFAAAILTGDRSGIDPAVLKNLRVANLAHLLAISGLHMGLLSGFVFSLIRYGFALFPTIAMRLPTKKIAAAVALGAGLGYLLLSGANVATQRAFIMTAVVLVAVLIDRPAFTMRAVALAATIVLILKPYSLLEAGFQMSFAATTALIVVYNEIRMTRIWQAMNGPYMRWLKPFVAIVLTSAVAGAATAPISAYYFNQISRYGLLANLLAVPVMGTLVMPSAVIAGVVSVFGASWPALAVMGQGVGWILEVARRISELDSAVIKVKSAPPFVLGLVVIAMLVAFLWRGRGRLVAIPVFLLALAFWSGTERPAVLISQAGKLMGVIGPEGRILSRQRGEGYAAGIWLENDGDSASQEAAFTRGGMNFDGKTAIWRRGKLRLVLVPGKSQVDLAEYCKKATILILAEANAPDGLCTIIGKRYLTRHGALAIQFKDGHTLIKGSKDGARKRPWGY